MLGAPFSTVIAVNVTGHKPGVFECFSLRLVLALGKTTFITRNARHVILFVEDLTGPLHVGSGLILPEIIGVILPSSAIVGERPFACSLVHLTFVLMRCSIRR